MVRRLAAIILVIGAWPSVYAANVHFLLGQRSFGDDTLRPVEDQELLGVHVDFGGELPFRWVLGLQTTSQHKTLGGPFQTDVDAKLRTGELDFGIAKIWEKQRRTRPFVGVGTSLIQVDKKVNLFGVIETDAAWYVGLYVNGGAYWRLGKRLHIGLDARFHYTDDEPWSAWDTFNEDE
jgi:hypothetical protein